MFLLKLKVVLWKNLIIRKRHIFLTCCEALLPVALFLLIAYGRSKISGLNKKEVQDVTYNQKLPLNYLVSNLNLEETRLFFSPWSTYFEDIIHRVQEKFEIINNNVQGFKDEQSLLMEYMKFGSNETVIGINFQSNSNSTHFDYTIRYHEPYFSLETERLYENHYSFIPGQGSTYYWKGLLALQMALDMSFIEKHTTRSLNFTMEMLEFPYPPYKSDTGLSSIFLDYLPLMTMLSFIFVCPAVLKRVVEEKYSGIKQLMRMVGMESWMLWLSWFMYSIIPMIISAVFITLILKMHLFNASYSPIEYASFSILMIFIILYCMAATTLCFFLSTFFNKPSLATLVGLLVWILTYFIPKCIIDSAVKTTFSTSILLMLFPNMALYFGYRALSFYEEREIGLQWSNWRISGDGGQNEVTMVHVFMMLLVDIVFYMLVTFYLDAVNPGKYGMRQSFFFPLKYLTKFCKRIQENNAIETVPLDVLERCESSKKAIELINLTKMYGKKTAVSNLSLDIYKDQITVLLGHNGAGKSTVMGMISGMLRKTSGNIIINGEEVKSTLDNTIGLCLQHNLFFPDLNVEEHLKFFAMLRGKTAQGAETEITYLLEKLMLTNNRKAMTHALSGGMKRKLSLGMAIIGGSKILILDEPSSGMDPESRRELWDLLLKWRKEKTILITTHFMDEADVLADWIAIMDEGKLRCYGSPMFLKKKYETGYNLKLLMKNGILIGEAVKNLENEITMHIEPKSDGTIDHVKSKSIDGREVVFLLPMENKYIKLFEYLEKNMDKHGIESISFTITTLEDVFLQTKTDNKEKQEAETHKQIPFNSKGEPKLYLIAWALIFKRFKFILKKILTYLYPIIVAVIILFLGIFLSQGLNNLTSSGGPPFKVNLSSYGKTSVFLNSTSLSSVIKMNDLYKQTVLDSGSKFIEVKDVSEAIIKEGTKSIPYYRRHMVAAAEFAAKDQNLEIVGLYNNLATHSAPISLNLVTNTLVKAILGEQYSISMIHHPFDNINSDTSVDKVSEMQVGLVWLMIMPVGFLFFLGIFIYFPYAELSTRFAHLQFLSGVHPWLYFTTLFVGDLIIFFAFAVIMSVLTLFWTPFRGVIEIGAMCSFLMLYGFSGIPYAYLFGRAKSFCGSYALFIIMGIFLGVIPTVIVLVLEESGDDYYINTGSILKKVFLVVLPQFGFTYLGVKFSRKVINNYNFEHMPWLHRLSKCASEPNPCCYNDMEACNDYKSYTPDIQENALWICAGAIIYFLINILMHNVTLRRLCNILYIYSSELNSKKKKDSQNSFSSSEELNGKESIMTVRRLKKSYSGKPVVNVNFQLHKGECLGILGANGAGKTTTFRMLTKEIIKDQGDILYDNLLIAEDKYLDKLGYCPQYDALNYSLTGSVLLKTMAMLRGVKDYDAMATKCLNVFELTDVADIACGFYSGGNKRKLSFAMAVIGLPKVILLDEPTNGVDPSTRRKFWSLIQNMKERDNISFILTSHSMDECEALCNDVKIMKEGTIRKGGTISKLKHDIGGFSIKLKLKQTLDKKEESYDEVDGASHDATALGNLEDLKRYLQARYNGEIKSLQPAWLHYYIKNKGSKKWSQLFEEFHELRLKNPHLIEDYFISDASLEDVFLNVARSED